MYSVSLFSELYIDELCVAYQYFDKGVSVQFMAWAKQLFGPLVWQ